MKYSPDFNNAVTDRFRIANGYREFILTPRGFLYAVTVEVDLTDGWPEYTPKEENLKFRLTDSPYLRSKVLPATVYGEFEIQHLYGFHQGGIIFPEPLPNMNSARPYHLHLPADCPPIWVYMLNTRYKSVV